MYGTVESRKDAIGNAKSCSSPDAMLWIWIVRSLVSMGENGIDNLPGSNLELSYPPSVKLPKTPLSPASL